MYSKERHPPRFVPTLTEVVADKLEEAALSIAPSDDGSAQIWWQTEPVEVKPQVEGLPTVQEELLTSFVSPRSAQCAQATPEMEEVKSVLVETASAVNQSPNWAEVRMQVELEVQSRLPQLLEPLWQKFQLDAAQAIQDCVQQTLSQAMSRAQEGVGDTKL